MRDGAGIIGDTAATIDFLRHWEPAGPWVLTAILPDGGTETRTFHADQEADATAWIEKYQGVRNLYFSVNRPDRPLTLKASKTDIRWLLAFHVDVDPAGAADLASEQRRITERVLGFEPRPTVTVFSGNGVQSFWRVRDPIEISEPADFEAINKRLERALGGDHCHNIDRIMRLPGTINVPNKKKRAAGRQPALARVIEADWSRTYMPDDFEMVGDAVEDDEPKSSAADRQALPDWCQRVIEHGADPNGEHDYGADRSRAVYAVACELVRCGYTDQEIADILRDPANGISAHILDQPKPEEAALRQARKARAAISKDEAPEPWPQLDDITVADEFVPGFPIGFLPPPFSTFVADVADRMQVPSDFIAIPLLVEAAAMLGRTFRMAPKRHDNWTERPCLWGMIVAPAGAKKTPAATEALSFIGRMQADAWTNFKAEMEAWRQQDKEDKGPAPLLETMLVQESTVEALVGVLSSEGNADPRGVMLHRDELAGWLASMNKYRARGGDDRQFFLECWSGGSFRIDRKGTGTVFVDDLYLSIFGTTQPEVIRQILKGGDADGMTARWQLMAYPTLPDSVELVDRQPDHAARKAVEKRLREMRSAVPIDGLVDGVPKVLRFSGTAQMVFNDWLLATENREKVGAFAAHIAKYPGLFARLALVLHFMKHGSKAPGEVDEATAIVVRDFIDRYLEPHARRVYGHIAQHPAQAGAVRIARWLKAEGVRQFAARDIRRHGWAEFAVERDDDAITAALNRLEAHGWVRIVEKRPGKRGGRPTVQAVVNPAVSAVLARFRQ